MTYLDQSRNRPAAHRPAGLRIAFETMLFALSIGFAGAMVLGLVG
jgi:hypothetical protein